MGSKLDLTNKKFGKLIAIKATNKRNSNGLIVWKFKCDCGNITEHCGSQVKCGAIYSCGCGRQSKDQKLSVVKNIFRDYKYRCKKEFTLTLNDFHALIFSDCHYCKSKPYNLYRNGKKLKNLKVKTNGIDRIDNTKGYTIDNVVPCCIICNRAKLNIAYDSFLIWINKLKFGEEIDDPRQ